MPNSKTYRSLDLSTNCPKRKAGNPCSYCYVETARKHGIRAKRIFDRIEYKDDILKLRQATIDKLNQCGGLRLFSFGDYEPWMDNDLFKIIEHARYRKLKLKAITKVPSFILKYHDKIDIINISIDSLNEGAPIETAIKLKRKYNNVKIRAAIMNYEDLEKLSWVDIITLNHAYNGYHFFSKKELREIAEKYPNKVCCTTGNCFTCPIKCGAK